MLTAKYRTFPVSCTAKQRLTGLNVECDASVPSWGSGSMEQNIWSASQIIDMCRSPLDEKDLVGPGAPWCLHNGISGVILVLALLQSRCDECDIAESTVAIHVDRAVNLMQSIPSKALGLHFGLAGPGLALVFAGNVWNRNDWSVKGETLISQASAHCLQESDESDWTHGTAGVLHAALIAYGLTGERRWLTKIESLERRLIEQHVEMGGEDYWIGKTGRTPEHYFGFAHGIAGIGHVLHSAARVTSNPLSKELVSGILATLTTRSVEKNWPRSVEDPQRSYFWCHGAPGIIHFLAHVSDEYPEALTLAEEAASGMKHMDGVPPLSRCHGILSRTEAYHHLYRVSGRKHHLDSAYRTLSYCSFLRAHNMAPGWRDDALNTDTLSLMTGALGVASGIMQVAYDLPDPILLEEILPTSQGAYPGSAQLTMS